MSLLDKFNQAVDFGVGTWRADLYIIEYPGALGTFAHLSTVQEIGAFRWLILANSSLTLTPDPDVTKLWDFYRYHYDLYIKGPNVGSKTEHIDHGPFRLDK